MSRKESGKTKYCRECGAKIPRDSIFCETCGMQLSPKMDNGMPSPRITRVAVQETASPRVGGHQVPRSESAVLFSNARKPLCRTCSRPMELLDESEQRWYCYDDDELLMATEKKWGEKKWVGDQEKQSAPAVTATKSKHTYSGMATAAGIIAILLIGGVYLEAIGIALALYAMYKGEGKSAWSALALNLGLIVISLLLAGLLASLRIR